MSAKHTFDLRGKDSPRRNPDGTRRNFAEVLARAEVNVADEYASLYEIVYEQCDDYGHTFHDLMGFYFEDMPFRGTEASLKDFERRHDMAFSPKGGGSLDELLALCELVGTFALNIAVAAEVEDSEDMEWSLEVCSLARKVLDRVGYRFVEEGDVVIAVPKDAAVNAAAAVAPEEVVGDIFCYRHRCFEGDLDGKSRILAKLANELEPRREELKGVSSKVERDLFCMLNKLNIRHNNLDPASAKNYNAALAAMSNEEREKWLDHAYDLCVTTILLLGYAGWKDELDALKEAGKG